MCCDLRIAPPPSPLGYDESKWEYGGPSRQGVYNIGGGQLPYLADSATLPVWAAKLTVISPAGGEFSDRDLQNFNE